MIGRIYSVQFAVDKEASEGEVENFIKTLQGYLYDEELLGGTFLLCGVRDISELDPNEAFDEEAYPQNVYSVPNNAEEVRQEELNERVHQESNDLFILEVWAKRAAALGRGQIASIDADANRFAWSRLQNKGYMRKFQITQEGYKALGWIE